VSLALSAGLLLSCAGTIQITYAAGEGAKSWVRAKNAECPAQKTTVTEEQKLLGRSETTTVTEPVDPPVEATSRGGAIPKMAWWLTAFCFISPTC
jgi:hypothetical protein